MQWWFKKFCKEDSLEDEKHSGWLSEVDKDQLRGSLKLILLQLHGKLLKNSVSAILWSFSIWSKLERWQSLISGCLMSWQQIKKTLFWNVVFSYSMQQQRTISGSDCDVWQKVDFIRQPATASTVVEPRRSSTALSKTKLAPNKGHGHCLLVCCQSYPLQLSESPGNHYIWEYALETSEMHQKLQCLQPALVNRKDPILHSARLHVAQPALEKLNE